MGHLTAPRDEADPGWRALAGVERLRRRDRRARVTAVLILGALGIASPLLAAPITGDPGATVGGCVAALLLFILATAIAPYGWSSEEQHHRELEAIWRELRPGADQAVPWPRCAAWAEPADGAVELVLIVYAPAAERVGGAPSPYSREVIRRVDADDVAQVAQVMEELRAEASLRELAARSRLDDEQREAERRAHDEALRAIDTAAKEDVEANERRLEQELAEQERVERKAQAEAAARAVRRP